MQEKEVFDITDTAVLVLEDRVTWPSLPAQSYTQYPLNVTQRPPKSNSGGFQELSSVGREESVSLAPLVCPGQHNLIPPIT